MLSLKATRLNSRGSGLPEQPARPGFDFPLLDRRTGAPDGGWLDVDCGGSLLVFEAADAAEWPAWSSKVWNRSSSFLSYPAQLYPAFSHRLQLGLDSSMGARHTCKPLVLRQILRALAFGACTYHT